MIDFKDLRCQKTFAFRLRTWPSLSPSAKFSQTQTSRTPIGIVFLQFLSPFELTCLFQGPLYIIGITLLFRKFLILNVFIKFGIKPEITPYLIPLLHVSKCTYTRVYNPSNRPKIIY